MKMLPVLLTLATLYGCGGGGTSTIGPVDKPATVIDRQITAAMPSQGVYVPALILGNFTNDGAKYVLSAGWISNGIGTGLPLAPIKILKINADNTATDATAAILGGEQLASTNIPIVADFNGDGIDDIFLPGFRDMPVGNTGSVVFLSRSGQPHQRVELPDQVWSHGAVAADVNSDGTIDVVNSRGQMWLNDGHGNFTFRDYAYNLNNLSVGAYMNGSGVCAGDFNNTGHTQIVITDVENTAQHLPISDTIIFELDDQLRSTNWHALPVPILDRGKTTETSHDITCQVADVNGDGKPDIIVISRPLDTARNGQWTSEGRIQIYLNQGDWIFTDITDTIVGYDQNVVASYTPMVMDLNNDGKLDIWLGSPNSANQALLNTNGIMTRAMKSIIDSYGATGPMIPVKFGNQWSLVYTKFHNSGYTYHISTNKVQF